ncbi:metal-sensing transcriptional repressor [Hippea jasoniae]|uniref:metal-sensing transcriptional repressor n=1 Tax=Hippea jasoniae TaxID=944479 RepID=UPI000554B3AF|nr:metal-sensing transcriptional repressor [Hippea jasoniae]
MEKADIKHKEAYQLLKTALGHLKAVTAMIEENRYCIDISTQLMAVISILKKSNAMILSKHLKTCIKDAVRYKDESEIDEKIEEMDKIIKYIIKM